MDLGRRGLVLVALALRLGPLGQSMFGDELFLYAIVHDRSAGDVLHAVQATEKTPPLGFLLSWAFDGGGHADVLVRVPSLVANLATVPLVYVLAKLTVGRAAGFVAAAWTTLSAFQIFYATESRGYALAELLVVLSTVILLVALERRALRWWLAYALRRRHGIHPLHSRVVLVPQAAWALWTHRDQARRIVVAKRPRRARLPAVDPRVPRAGPPQLEGGQVPRRDRAHHPRAREQDRQQGPGRLSSSSPPVSFPGECPSRCCSRPLRRQPSCWWLAGRRSRPRSAAR